MPSGPSIIVDIWCSCCASARTGFKANPAATPSTQRVFLLKFINDSRAPDFFRSMIASRVRNCAGRDSPGVPHQILPGISRAVAAAQADEPTDLWKSKAQPALCRDSAEGVHAASQIGMRRSNNASPMRTLPAGIPCRTIRANRTRRSHPVQPLRRARNDVPSPVHVLRSDHSPCPLDILRAVPGGSKDSSPGETRAGGGSGAQSFSPESNVR